MLNINTHKTILLRILKEIYSDSSIGPLLGFKGGTALYFFYDLNRFSLDLDFDLLDSSKEKYVLEKIGKILLEFGKVREKYNKRYTLFFLLSYSPGTPNIKVEISKRSSISDYELKNHLGISMLVMKKEDLAANKLIALTERSKPANRDIFDLWFILKNNWEINEEIIKKRLGLTLKQQLYKAIKFVEGTKEKNILAGLGEILDPKTKIWTKKNLKADVLFLLKIRYENEKKP